MRNRWWGGPIALLGLALMVLSMSAGWVLGIVGAGLTTVGLWLLVHAVRLRWIATRKPPDNPT
jgi:hypothetical protein